MLFSLPFAPLPHCVFALSLSYFRIPGGSFPRSRCGMAKVVQRRVAPLFSPRFRQFGGASRVSRRFYATNFRNLAAVPALAAGTCGGNFRK
jgi:hypothetical protein